MATNYLNVKPNPIQQYIAPPKPPVTNKPPVTVTTTPAKPLEFINPLQPSLPPYIGGGSSGGGSSGGGSSGGGGTTGPIFEGPNQNASQAPTPSSNGGSGGGSSGGGSSGGSSSGGGGTTGPIYSGPNQNASQAPTTTPTPIMPTGSNITQATRNTQTGGWNVTYTQNGTTYKTWVQNLPEGPNTARWNTTGGYYLTPTGNIISSNKSPLEYGLNTQNETQKYLDYTSSIHKYYIPQGTKVYDKPIKIADPHEKDVQSIDLVKETEKRGKALYDKGRTTLGKQILTQISESQQKEKIIQKEAEKIKESIKEMIQKEKYKPKDYKNMDSKEQENTILIEDLRQKYLQKLEEERIQKNIEKGIKTISVASQETQQYAKNLEELENKYYTKQGMAHTAFNQNAIEMQARAGGDQFKMILESSQDPMGIFKQLEKDPKMLTPLTGLLIVPAAYGAGYVSGMVGIGADLLPFNYNTMTNKFTIKTPLEQTAKSLPEMPQAIVQMGEESIKNPIKIPFFIGQMKGMEQVMGIAGKQKTSGLYEYLMEIDPKTRTLRYYNPVKFLMKPEWAEQVITEANFAKLVKVAKEIDYLKGAKMFKPETFIRDVRMKLGKENIPKEVRNTIIKESLIDKSLEFTGSTITKNAYTMKVAKALLKEKLINAETYEKLVKTGDLDILKRTTNEWKETRIPKNYENLPPELRGFIRGLMKTKEQQKYITKKGKKAQKGEIQIMSKELIDLTPEYPKIYAEMKTQEPLLHKGSITRGHEIYNNYLKGEITEAQWKKYIESLAPKEIELPNKQKIYVFKDIDTEALIATNKAKAIQQMEKIVKRLPKHETLVEKIDVGVPKLRLLDRTKTLQVQDITKEDPATNYIKRQFGRSNVAYLTDGATKRFTLIRALNKFAKEYNEKMGYKGNDPRAMNKYTVDIGIDNFFGRLKKQIDRKVEMKQGKDTIGYAQTTYKNLMDALDVKALNKLIKQELYLEMKRKTGELKPFEKNKIIKYQRDLKNTANDVFRKIQENKLKKEGKIEENIVPSESGEGIYTFGDPETHPLQLLHETHDLYPTNKSVYYRGKVFANPESQILQQYQAAIESGDLAKLKRSEIQLQRAYDSSYYKIRGKQGTKSQKSKYNLAKELLEKETTERNWKDYLIDRVPWHRLKTKTGEPERIDILGLRKQQIKTDLFKPKEQIAKELAEKQNLTKKELQTYTIKNAKNNSKIEQIIKEKNIEKKTEMIKQLIDENALKKEEFIEKYAKAKKEQYKYERLKENKPYNPYEKYKTENYKEYTKYKEYQKYGEYKDYYKNKYEQYGKYDKLTGKYKENYKDYKENYPNKTNYKDYTKPNYTNYETYEQLTPKYNKYGQYNTNEKEIKPKDLPDPGQTDEIVQGYKPTIQIQGKTYVEQVLYATEKDAALRAMELASNTIADEASTTKDTGKEIKEYTGKDYSKLFNQSGSRFIKKTEKRPTSHNEYAFMKEIMKMRKRHGYE